MNDHIPEEISRLVPLLESLECWYVSTGGAAGSTFQLSLGEKIRRDIPLKNSVHSEEFRHFEGSASILVWCAWRLDSVNGPITSWDDAQQGVEEGLHKLIGQKIESVDLIPLAWDVNVTFSNGLCLRVFCDHVPGDPSFDGNWDLRIRDVIVAFGPGAKYGIKETRHARR